jgi:hypothetical protein
VRPVPNKHRRRADSGKNSPQAIAASLRIPPPGDKIRVLTELEVLEINIGPGHNAWGYTIERLPMPKGIQGQHPGLVIYDEVQAVPRQEGEPP